MGNRKRVRGEKGVEGLVKREKVEAGCQVMGDQRQPRDGTVSLFHSRPNPELPGVLWLKILIVNAGDPGLIPGQGARSHLLQLRVRCHN